MIETVTVREYARLTTQPIDNASLDRAQISLTAFDWLCKLNASFDKAGASLVELDNRRWLRLNNYVGVIETPCGTRVEILPKHFEVDNCIELSRSLLRRMIQGALDLPRREVGLAHLQVFDAPLNEWVMSQFLDALDYLVKRGVRFDYHRVEEEQRYLKGQLDLAKQMHQPLERRHYFQIRHDVFLPDGPENRLIKLALDYVCKSTQSSNNWRLGQELRGLLREVPESRTVKKDFKDWRADRLMAHYRRIKPWCELILNQKMPVAIAGDWKGISFLFPMERLFEKYVGACLRKCLQVDATLKLTPSYKSLCHHEGSSFFGLEPDMMISQGHLKWILDTKWKLIDQLDRKNSYGLSQADFYQLFAYGNKYLDGQGDGDLVLIYPKRTAFDLALPVFHFSESLRLWVLPFDLDNERLEQPELMHLPILRSSDLVAA